jgi:hypothetical protein
VIGNDAGYAPGTNVTDVVVMTPFELKSVKVSGVDTPSHPLLEGRIWRHTVRVAVPSGGTTTVVFQLEGAVTAGSRYQLAFIGQPLVNESNVNVTVLPTSGTTVVKGAGAAHDTPATARIDGQADAAVTWKLTS